MKRWHLLAAAMCAGSAMACGTEGDAVERFGPEDTLPIAHRGGAVVLEGCALDSWQSAQLASGAARRVLQEVILLCPTMRASGDVVPADPDARAALVAQVAAIRAMGYRVSLGVRMADDLGMPASPDRDVAAFASPQWRATVIASIADLAKAADGIEIDLQRVPSAIRGSLTAFFSELSTAVRLGGARTPVGVFVPPSVTTPSDVQGGDAYDVAAIARSVDRVRVMTLDYSCCGAAPGPAIDSGWAVDAARLAIGQVGTTPIDVAVPLYGTDFAVAGERAVTYLEARAVADSVRASPTRGPNGTLHFKWADAAGGEHETWFDDGVSIARVLHAWDTGTLGGSVGVVFYGLGAEDPMLWDTVARGMAQ